MTAAQKKRALNLPESLPLHQRETAALRVSDFNLFVAIDEIARKPGMALLLVVNSIFAFAFNGAGSISNVFVAQKFGAQPWQIGLLFVVAGAITFLTQMVFIERVVARFGEKTMAVASLGGPV